MIELRLHKSIAAHHLAFGGQVHAGLPSAEDGMTILGVGDKGWGVGVKTRWQRVGVEGGLTFYN